MDLILRHANLPDGRRDIDIGIAVGQIVAVERALDAPAAQEIDVSGRLVSPPFVDAHFHIDSTLSLGTPRHNESGTLLEGIALWGELKPHLTYEALVERALRYCDLAVAQGLLAELNEPLLSSTLLLPGDELPLNDAQEIRTRLERSVELVLDAGSCGIEMSTVVDLTGELPQILRSGKGDLGLFGAAA